MARNLSRDDADALIEQLRAMIKRYLVSVADKPLEFHGRSIDASRVYNKSADPAVTAVYQQSPAAAAPGLLATIEAAQQLAIERGVLPGLTDLNKPVPRPAPGDAYVPAAADALIEQLREMLRILKDPSRVVRTREVTEERKQLAQRLYDASVNPIVADLYQKECAVSATPRTLDEVQENAIADGLLPPLRPIEPPVERRASAGGFNDPHMAAKLAEIQRCLDASKSMRGRGTVPAFRP